MHGGSPEDDQTDGPLEFIQNIVDNVRSEFEEFLEDGDKKKFLRILSKIFTILLSVKADGSEKIIKIVKFSISTVLKTWSEFKIKTLLPEQKVLQIKKNEQVIRTIAVRRKTKKFTNHWARTF